MRDDAKELSAYQERGEQLKAALSAALAPAAPREPEPDTRCPVIAEDGLRCARWRGHAGPHDTAPFSPPEPDGEDAPLPCPFCGSKDTVVVADGPYAQAMCEDCDASGPQRGAPRLAVRDWNAVARLRAPRSAVPAPEAQPTRGQRLAEIPVEVDPTMPPGEIHFKDAAGNVVAKITGIAPEAQPEETK